MYYFISVEQQDHWQKIFTVDCVELTRRFPEAVKKLQMLTVLRRTCCEPKASVWYPTCSCQNQTGQLIRRQSRQQLQLLLVSWRRDPTAGGNSWWQWCAADHLQVAAGRNSWRRWPIKVDRCLAAAGQSSWKKRLWPRVGRCLAAAGKNSWIELPGPLVGRKSDPPSWSTRRWGPWRSRTTNASQLQVTFIFRGNFCIHCSVQLAAWQLSFGRNLIHECGSIKFF